MKSLQRIESKINLRYPFRIMPFLYCLSIVCISSIFLSPSPLDSKDEKLQFIHKEEKNYHLKIWARNFAQGEVLQLRIEPKKDEIYKKDFKLVVDSKEVPLHPRDRDFIGFIPVHPERKPGPMVIELHSKQLFVKRGIKKYEVEIGPTDFLVIRKQSITLDQKFTQKEYDTKTLAFIKECTDAKTKAFESNSELQIAEGFVNPVSVVSFSSPFYVRRDYNKKKGKPHGGVDYKGKTGTPIYAVNAGTIVLAREMYFEGNFTIIDHGNKVFSFYMHQSKIDVTPGQKVKRGEKIGEIGSTGMSTGPHLHLGVKVNDTLVHPLSLLAFRKL